jgi:TolB-like protein/class 3 adenylate cyclase/Flp pilus assembly protein TadD
MQRRLAAILAADVVGYSRLMEEDELGTHEAFKAYRDSLLIPTIKDHRGRVVRLMGDGMIVEFLSAVDAVVCAIKIQEQTSERNKRLPEHRRIIVRIGINLGDVIVESDDIYGDEVNIAARLESLADPGSICISGAVHRQVKRAIKIPFDDLGEHKVKNISRQIHIYRLSIEPTTSSEATRAQEDTQRRLSARPSIAVLPFESRDSDGEYQYFCDGIAEDIVIELSRFRSLDVVARSSSFAYRGKPVGLKQIGQELGVLYLLEGAIRRHGERLRITVQLAECASGKEVWGERYDCRTEEIFAVQDEVISRIVGTLEQRVTQERLEMTKRIAPRSLGAYDYWLRGKKLSEMWTAETDDTSIQLFQQAIELDPDFARAYASLASVYNSRNLLLPGNPSNQQDLALGFDYAMRAVSLDPSDARNHVDLGWSYMLRHDFKNGQRQFELAGQLNPNDANTTIARALAKAFLGEPESGLQLAQKAITLNPFHPDYYLGNLATIHFLGANYEETIATIDRAPNVWPEISAWYAAACGHLGRNAEARAAAEKFIRDVRERWAGDRCATPTDFVRWLLQINSIRRKADVECLLEGLEKAGLPKIESGL